MCDLDIDVGETLCNPLSIFKSANEINQTRNTQLSSQLQNRIDDESQLWTKRCCVCSRGVTQATAFFYRIGRPKRLGSYITLCKACSQKIHTDRCVLCFDPEKYSSLRGVGRVMHGKIEFGRRLKSLDIPIFLVNGWRTAQCRKRMNLPKSSQHPD